MINLCKKILPILVLASILVLVVFLPLNRIQAQTPGAPATNPGALAGAAPTPPPVTPVQPTPSAGADLTSGTATVVLWGAYAILYLVQSLLNVLLPIVGTLLNTVFKFNVEFNPADWPVVRVGWTLARDIANSLFILIILWIAFTIIFDFEQYGGRKLFIRVLIVALIINFSLLAVTGVFGISNAIAKVFVDQMPEDISSAFSNAIKAQTAFTVYNPADLKTLQDTNNTAAANTQTSNGTGTTNPVPKAVYSPRWQDTLLSSLGIEKTEALSANEVKVGCAVGAGYGVVAGAGVFSLPGAAAGCIGGGVLAAIGSILFNFMAASRFQQALNASIALGLGNIFLAMNLFAFLSASLVLSLRIGIMMVLSILAPLAILLYVVPVGGLQSYSKQWMHELVNWAFFAPMFYFIFYLTLLLLQQTDQGSVSAVHTIAYLDVGRILQLILAIVLIGMAIKLARKTGGVVADATMNAGKKIGGFALGAATGGAALGAGYLARKNAPAIESSLQKLSARPVLGKLTAPAARRITGYLESRKEEVEKHKKEVGGWSTNNLAQEFDRSISPARKAAVAELLATKDAFDKIRNKSAEALRVATQFGNQMVILEKVPHLATVENVKGPPNITNDAEAIDFIIKKVKEREKIDKSSFDIASNPNLTPAIRDNVLRAIWTNTSHSELSEIGMRNQQLMVAMQNHINSLTQAQITQLKTSMGPQRVTQFKNYFDGNIAQGLGQQLGWQRPTNW